MSRSHPTTTSVIGTPLLSTMTWPQKSVHGPRDHRQKRKGAWSMKLFQLALGAVCIIIILATNPFRGTGQQLNHLDNTPTYTPLKPLKFSYPYQACRPNPEKHEFLHNLHAAAKWQTKRRLSSSSITIVTQTSLERLEMVGMQCSVWKDPLVAVVYIPLYNNRVINLNEGNTSLVGGMTIVAAKKIVQSFFDFNEAADDGCALTVELVVENFDKEDDPYAALYPFNALRNRALKLAQTEAVLMLDADFLSSAGLASFNQNAASYNNLIKLLEDKTAIVLPAFSIGDPQPYILQYTSDGVIEHYRKLAMAAAMLGKSFVIDCYKDDILLAAVSYWLPAHGPTDYDRWMTANETYEVEYKKFYEPYILVHRKYVPWYDERFRGYGNDKVQHLAQLASFGVKLKVHPTEFCIHMPHRLSVTVKASFDSTKHQDLMKLHGKIETQIKTHEFIPVTTFSDDKKLCPGS